MCSFCNQYNAVCASVLTLPSPLCRRPRAGGVWTFRMHVRVTIQPAGREEISAAPPVLQTHAAPDVTASLTNTVHLKLLSVLTLRKSLGCKHKGENVIFGWKGESLIESSYSRRPQRKVQRNKTPQTHSSTNYLFKKIIIIINKKNYLLSYNCCHQPVYSIRTLKQL